MALTALGMKLVSMATIFVACFVGGLLPLRFSQWFGAKSLKYSNCCAAGILLGAALIHLLFDSEEGKTFEYPLGHLLCGVGFFGAFILEKVIFNHHHDHPEHKHSVNQMPHHKYHHFDSSSGEHHHGHGKTSTQGNNADSSVREKEKENVNNPLLKNNSIDGLEEISEEDASGIINQDSDMESVKIDNGNVQQQGPSLILPAGTDIENTGLPHPHHTGIPWILFIVLSIESAITGSALGVQKDFIGALVMFIAIETHIWAESFALSANTLKSPIPHKTVVKLIFGFSLVTPLSILLGILLEESLQGEIVEIISDSLIALASGTFLFISTLEIIAEEFETEEGKWPKLFLMLLGFGFMSLLGIWL